MNYRLSGTEELIEATLERIAKRKQMGLEGKARLIVAVLLVIAAALVDGGVNGGYEAGVRHELPAPHVPQCYAIIELGGGFCQFRL